MLTANKSSNDKKWQITTEKMTEKGKKPNYVGVRFKISYFAKICPLSHLLRCCNCGAEISAVSAAI